MGVLLWCFIILSWLISIIALIGKTTKYMIMSKKKKCVPESHLCIGGSTCVSSGKCERVEKLADDILKISQIMVSLVIATGFLLWLTPDSLWKQITDVIIPTIIP